MTDPAYPLLEAAPVGSALCLFRPDSGRLGLLNGAARTAFEEHGTDWPGIKPLLRPYFPPAQPEFPSPPRAALAKLDATIGGSVRLLCHDDTLAGLLRSVLAPFLTERKGKPPTTLCCAQSAKTGAFQLWRDDSIIGAGIPRAEVRRRTLMALAVAANAPAPIAAILHGCAVRLGNGAVLLVGRSGAGKSTLTAALVAAGADYLGDDLIPLCADGRSIAPFPVALSVKPGSWDAVGHAFPLLHSQAVQTVGRAKIRYLPLASRSASAAVPVCAIVFPSYEPGAKSASRPLSPEEALALLIDSGSEIVGEPASAIPLVNLVEQTPSIHLNYEQTASASAIIARLGAGK